MRKSIIVDEVDRSNLEEGVREKMISAMGEPPGDATPATLVDVLLEGSYPSTEIVVLFRCPAKSEDIYGYKAPLWEDDIVTELGPQQFVTSMWLDIHETLMTDLGLPTSSDRGADGIGWIRTDI